LQYPRIQSTLRGANLLGAYLIIVWSATLSYLRRYWLLSGSVAVVAVLFLSGSRAAWVGALVAALVLGFLEIPGRRRKEIVLAAGVFVLLLGAGSVFVLRDNNFVQNTVFHSDENSSSSESSNAAHFRASHAAAKQIAREPFGRGPGTAGPASLYNTKEPARIAENYFLQIGQELGWVGLALYIEIYILVGRQLWKRRADQLARALFAAFIGLTCVAMLMHLWTDDTVAYLFWGLAGVALAPQINRGNHAPKHP
jgi:O-antigen ligase